MTDICLTSAPGERRKEVDVPAVLTQLTQHVVENVFGLVEVITVERLQPAWKETPDFNQTHDNAHSCGCRSNLSLSPGSLCE